LIIVNYRHDAFLRKGIRYRTPRFHESESGIFLLDPDWRFGSVVDRQRFDANPDPDPDWHHNYADPHADPVQSSAHVENSAFSF
jgi:hypothetical protein